MGETCSNPATHASGIQYDPQQGRQSANQVFQRQHSTTNSKAKLKIFQPNQNENNQPIALKQNPSLCTTILYQEAQQMASSKVRTNQISEKSINFSSSPRIKQNMQNEEKKQAVTDTKVDLDSYLSSCRPKNKPKSQKHPQVVNNPQINRIISKKKLPQQVQLLHEQEKKNEDRLPEVVNRNAPEQAPKLLQIKKDLVSIVINEPNSTTSENNLEERSNNEIAQRISQPINKVALPNGAQLQVGNNLYKIQKSLVSNVEL